MGAVGGTPDVKHT